VTFQLRGGGESAPAEVDPDQMQQVLTNLAVNGIQAMPGGGTLAFRIAVERARPPATHGGQEGEYTRIDIEDQGTGISGEVKAHLFEPFFTTKSVGEGTGLGLSVSHGIVQEHRGWIGVATEVGKGTCFSIFLPRR
jgi:signal transduction histidine kinase